MFLISIQTDHPDLGYSTFYSVTSDKHLNSMSLLAVTFTNRSTALHYNLLFHMPSGVRAVETHLEQCSHIMCADVAALYLILVRNRV